MSDIVNSARTESTGEWLARFLRGKVKGSGQSMGGRLGRALMEGRDPRTEMSPGELAEGIRELDAVEPNIQPPGYTQFKQSYSSNGRPAQSAPASTTAARTATSNTPAPTVAPASPDPAAGRIALRNLENQWREGNMIVPTKEMFPNKQDFENATRAYHQRRKNTQAQGMYPTQNPAPSNSLLD